MMSFEVTRFRGGPFLKWPVFEGSHYQSVRFQKAIFELIVFEVSYFRNDHFWSDTFFEVTNFRSNRKLWLKKWDFNSRIWKVSKNYCVSILGWEKFLCWFKHSFSKAIPISRLERKNCISQKNYHLCSLNEPL